MFEKSLEEISFGQVLMDLMAEAKNFEGVMALTE
jgi:hypothetical protein